MNKNDLLKDLFEHTRHCRNCRLSTSRNQYVFGEGNPDSPIIFIGEAPGKQEDLSGKPFIGKSGMLLEYLINEVFSVSRDELYITNLVKCRPSLDLKMEKDRAPEKEEVDACINILYKQLTILKPKAIVTLGASSTKYLLKNNKPISKVRGQWFEYNGISLMPTFHPSYILRNGGKNSVAWNVILEDLIQVKKQVTWKT